MKKLMLVILLLILMMMGYRWFILPPPLLDNFSFSQAVYDEHGHLLRITLSKDEKYRIFTPLNEISPLLVEATLLQEDQYFFSHFGFNPIALIKAAWQTYIVRSRPIGASTITMQLARILYDMHTKSNIGKLKQILRALQLEFFYSKQQILEAYLNLAPYGGNIEGVGAASLIYLDKSANQLNLPDALELAVIPQNPLRRAPGSTNKNNLESARKKLFERWVAIHPKDSFQQDLIDLPLQLTKKNLPFQAPHFVDLVLHQNHQSRIDTTLLLELQTIAENITRQYLQKQEEYGMSNAAVMLVDARNLGIKALVGSGDYFNADIHGQVNGTQAKRSPGSTLKPFIYALAIDQGLIHPYTVLHDIPSNFSGYNPENFEKDYLGPIKAKDALILSRNIPALFLAQQLNPSLHHFLKKASISRLKQEKSYGLTIALGTAELTMEELVSLYAMLANHGLWHPLRTQMDSKPTKGIFLLSPEASFLTLDMLRDTPRPSINQEMTVQVYWKTGTSSAYRDGWAIGIFGPYVLAVWVGDFHNKEQSTFIGSKSAAPLFFSLIDAFCKHMGGQLPDLVKVTPDMNLTKVKVCEASGRLPTYRNQNLVDTWFIPGKSPITKDYSTEPKKSQNNFKSFSTYHIQ